MRYARGRGDHVVNVERVAPDGDHFTACGDPECSGALRHRQEQNALDEPIVLRLRDDGRLLDTVDDFSRSVRDFAEQDDLRTAPHRSVRHAKLERSNVIPVAVTKRSAVTNRCGTAVAVLCSASRNAAVWCLVRALDGLFGANLIAEPQVVGRGFRLIHRIRGLFVCATRTGAATVKNKRPARRRAHSRLRKDMSVRDEIDVGFRCGDQHHFVAVHREVDPLGNVFLLPDHEL